MNGQIILAIVLRVLNNNYYSLNNMLFTKLFGYFIFFISSATKVLAADENPNAGSCKAGTICDPLGGVTVESLSARIILYLLGISGTIALIMFIWGGLQWMTSAGSSDKIKKGKDTMLWAALGLVIVFSSWAVIRSVLEIISF